MRRTGLCARLLRDNRGSTAIEFAMLALPFAFLVFAILESCISFAGEEVMANATDNVARQLRTGQMSAATVTDTSLKQAICSQLQIIVAQNCPGLQVDLRQYASFAAAAQAGFNIQNGAIVLTGTSPATFTVAPGPSSSKNMLRVFYKWPVMTNFMATTMSNMGTGYTLHFASTTWQNEPFND
ncbi:TadE/TadG family type IV pilus assembly protein [Mesorhizobium sp.]|uniref:TadE/TadG family type IV pilus assembly protein n=1 Tax=Mesorhizobium sp. TaxID=1871066 RepID=UPI003BAD4292